jgi:hypothetical protein
MDSAEERLQKAGIRIQGMPWDSQVADANLGPDVDLKGLHPFAEDPNAPLEEGKAPAADAPAADAPAADAPAAAKSRIQALYRKGREAFKAYQARMLAHRASSKNVRARGASKRAY